MNITAKKLKVTCIFHKGCMDGWMSALPIWLAYHEIAEMKFIPAHYSDAPPVVDEDDYVFIVDFSYKPDVIANWFTGNAEVFLLDHHQNAIAALIKSPLMAMENKFGQKVFQSASLPKFTAFLAFNEIRAKKLQQSGSGLAVEFLATYKDSIQASSVSNLIWEEVLATIAIAQSYDLWHHDGEEMHQNTFLSMFFRNWEKTNREKFNRMQSHPQESHALMMELVADWQLQNLEAKLDYGKSVTIEHGIKCRALCETAYEVKLPVTGHNDAKIGFIPGEKLDVSVSTLGSIAVREFGWDVMVMIAAVKDNNCILTLRSNENAKSVDVANIAEQIGEGLYGLTGGGHRNAAGCTIRQHDLQEVVARVVTL